MWKSHPDCFDYEVSQFGQVRRVVQSYRGKPVPYLLGQRSGNSGYLFVSLTLGGKPRNVSVSRLVLRTFVGDPPSSKHHAAHNDGNKLNNILTNLRWASPSENQGDKREHGTAFRPRFLTEDQVISMRREYADLDVSFRDIARKYGVSVPTAHGVVVGRYWPHLPGAVQSKSKGRKTIGYVTQHNENGDFRR